MNDNKEEVYAQTTGGSAHLVQTDAVVSPATDIMSTLYQCVSELC